MKGFSEKLAMIFSEGFLQHGCNKSLENVMFYSKPRPQKNLF